MSTSASIRERSKASSNGAADHDDSIDQREANGYGSTYTTHVTLLLIAASILLRLLVGLHSYSGELRWSLMLIMQSHALYLTSSDHPAIPLMRCRCGIAAAVWRLRGAAPLDGAHAAHANQ